jgi:hypothetical protein
MNLLVAFCTTPWRKGQTPKLENNKKNAKLQYWKDQMLIEIKCGKPIKHQLEEHVKYDGMNKDEVNPNGKHQ